VTEPAAGRPRLATSKFEDKVAITGVGASDIGRRLMRTPLSLTVEACSRAVEDAGLAFEDIDGLSSYPGGGNFGGFGEGGVTALEAALGLRPTWYNGGIETFGPGGSLLAAMLAVAGDWRGTRSASGRCGRRRTRGSCAVACWPLLGPPEHGWAGGCTRSGRRRPRTPSPRTRSGTSISTGRRARRWAGSR
jgi:hypothetical protein